MFSRDVTLTDVERLARVEARAVETLQMDEDTFRAFYDRTARPVWIYLARITGDRALADDLLQESYYRFLRAERCFDSESHRRNYLYRIATNLAHDRHRSRRGVVSVPCRPSTSRPRSPATTMSPATPNGGRTWAAQWRNSSRANGSCSGWRTPRDRRTRRSPQSLGLRRASIKMLLFRARRRLAALLTGRPGQRA